jgi:Flp pilus assembly protein TadD
VEIKPLDAAAYTGMGITYWKMNETQLAKAAWQRSLELNPDSNEARGWLMIAQQG